MTGARSVKAVSEQYKMKPKYVFIAPPAIEKLQQRLELRWVPIPCPTYDFRPIKSVFVIPVSLPLSLILSQSITLSVILYLYLTLSLSSMQYQISPFK
jgi:hypothetical protein